VSGYVPLEEFKAIRQSWRAGKGEKRFAFGGARENLERCHGTLRALAEEERRLRDLDARLPAGDNLRVGGTVNGEETPPLRYLIRKNSCEQRHWREYVTHYQALAAAEPVPRRPVDPIPEDRRLPREREVGEDDDEVAHQ
jgi:hypothetical protein